MFIMHKLFFFFVLLNIHSIYQVVTLPENYYWREYTGSIPVDAIVGGKDINGDNVYIGQVYVKNKGLFVGGIYLGKTEVVAVIGGVKRFSKYIKILCSPRRSFFWLPVNLTHLHTLLIDKHAVIGGHQDDYGQINIGRISHQGGIKLGKINSFNVETAEFHFDHENEEKSVSSCEILIYDNNYTPMGTYNRLTETTPSL